MFNRVAPFPVAGLSGHISSLFTITLVSHPQTLCLCLCTSNIVDIDASFITLCKPCKCVQRNYEWDKLWTLNECFLMLLAYGRPTMPEKNA